MPVKNISELGRGAAYSKFAQSDALTRAAGFQRWSILSRRRFSASSVHSVVQPARPKISTIQESTLG